MAEPVRCAATAVTSFEATGERYLHGYSWRPWIRRTKARKAKGGGRFLCARTEDGVHAGASDLTASGPDCFADLLLDHGDQVFAVLSAGAGERLRERSVERPDSKWLASNDP
jgi:hypothetical protein